MNIVPLLTHLLLADDQPAVAEQIARLLADERAAEFEIVGTVGNGRELLEAAARLDPDVVILDITMPDMDGIETARRLRQAGSRAKLIFLTVHDDADYVRAGMEAGAAGYVVKERLATDLLSALHAVTAGRCFVSPAANYVARP